MLSPEKVQEVERLLQEGRVSQRRIAKMTGVSRGSVGAIANGTRHLYERKPDDLLPQQEGPIVRCPLCGAKTRMPCLTCLIRADRRQDAADRWIPRISAAFGVELRPRHRERYEEIVAWRRSHPDRPWRDPSSPEEGFSHPGEEAPSWEIDAADGDWAPPGEPYESERVELNRQLREETDASH